MTIGSERKRNFELDRMNVLYCLIVVFIHVFGIYTMKLTQGSRLQMLSSVFMKNCAFVVQGFMFLSAYKYSMIYKNKKINYKRFLWSRIKKVAVPYIVSVCVYYVVYYKIAYVPVLDVKELLWYILRGDLAAHFYFVPAILQFYLLMPLWIWLSKKLNPMLLVLGGTLIFLLWLYYFAGICVFFDRIFLSYLPFWAAGLAAGRNDGVFRKKVISCGWLIAAVYIILYVFNGFAREAQLFSPVGLEIVHTLYCFGAILLTYLIFSKDERGLSLVAGGINSLSFEIYLWHCLLLPFADKLLAYLSLPMLWQEAAVRALSVYSVIFAVGLIRGLLIKYKKGVIKK